MNANDWFGYSTALDGDILVVGAPYEDCTATGINGWQWDNFAHLAGAVYVFRRNGSTWTQEAYLKAFNTNAEDHFGWSVALNGDTLAVGAPVESSAATGVDGDQTNESAPNAGAVYIFRHHDSTWTQEAYIKASNTSAGDRFGMSLSIDGDTLVVGAPAEASNATGINGDQTNNTTENAGAVYVFHRSGSTWTQEAYIKASNTDTYDEFGRSLALDGDTLAVGAHYEASAAIGIDGDQADNSTKFAGAVYIFRHTGSTWTQEAYIKASNTDAGDRFGTSVALDGDILTISAPYEDSNATGVNGDQKDNSDFDTGAVYVFRRRGTRWTQEAYIKASNTGMDDLFGSSLALDDDILVVGASGERSNATGVNGDQTDNSADNAGAVYVFRRTGSTWTLEAYLKASNTDIQDYFGISLALYGDTVVVGAPGEDSAATGVNGNQADNTAQEAGAVYVFRRNDSTWTQDAYIKASNTSADDYFG